MLLMMYLLLSGMVSFQAATDVGWLRASIFFALCFAGWWSSLQAALVARWVTGTRKPGLLSIQVVGLAVVVGSAYWLGVTVTIFDFHFPAGTWPLVGSAMGAWHGVTTRPDVDEIAAANSAPDAKEVTNREGRSNVETAVNAARLIAADYGDLLKSLSDNERNAVAYPARLLPANKATVGLALKILHAATKDDRMRQMLQGGYSELASFREELSQTVNDPLLEQGRRSQAGDTIDLEALHLAEPAIQRAQELRHLVLEESILRTRETLSWA